MATEEVYRGESESSTESTASTGRRIASAVLGGALLATGLRRRSLGGVAVALAGGWLLYRGVTGRSRSRDSSPSGAATGTAEGTEGSMAQARETTVERSVTVGKPADELYDLWRDPEQLNRVLGDSVEVTAEGEDRQRWTVEGPASRSVEWERWESVEGSRLSSEGSVHFDSAPTDRGTQVTLRLRFDPPGGTLGETAMNLLGIVPETLASKALDRFKSLAETGEIPTLDRNPSGRGRGDVV
ncbi:polyketide cyclase/dehydrase [Halobacteriales archaeon SW_6_65_15]|nr:MAG: polyketide cyclase/dehydrase [Halobacteriales archaeon SW_6_65_15]